MKCKAIKGDGKVCGNTTLEGEDICLYHSFSKQAVRLKEEGKKMGKGTTSIGMNRR